MILSNRVFSRLAISTAVSRLVFASTMENSSPPYASGDVVWSKAILDRRARCHQNLVTDVMTVLIVYTLEVVEVEQDQRERCLIPSGATYFPGRGFVEPMAITQPGKRIGVSLPPKLLYLSVEFAD